MGALKRFDHFQRTHRCLAIPLAVVKKFSNDQGGNLAAVVAYYAFFSLFPLLLVFVTILGYVLHGDRSTLDSVEHAVQRNFPGINGLLHFSALKGSVVALVLGVLTSLWSGLGVTGAAQNAFNVVWAVPMKSRQSYVATRLRGVALLVVLGVLFVVATGASGLVSAGLGGPLAGVAGIAGSILANIALFFAAFRLMTNGSIETRELWPGVILAALAWTLLQSIGGLYIHHVVSGLSSAYATFAIVIPLLVWLHLGAQITLYASELNTVLARRLWPRSLFGPPQEAADRETYAALAKAQERHGDETIEVSFDPPADASTADDPATSRTDGPATPA
jgi:membrane protein